ncbi:MAG: agmatine deiminase family protein [Alphaproteobacteria bacterium]|nr:agmatine deiminase family protein [Alphaproteobacteria bacterium]
MPAEWQRHERCWMGWPCRTLLWGERLLAARRAFADVARTIADFEPVTMVANPHDVAEASLMCGQGIDILALPLDDSWLRDTGPSFVHDAEGGLAGIAWRFNAWGERYLPYGDDAALSAAVLAHLKCPAFLAPLVLEGGAISVDGEGTLLATESSILNPNRNPGRGWAEVEQIFAGYLGVSQVIWLAGGLVHDETDGHVDNIACFVAPGRVLAAAPGWRIDPDYEMLRTNLERLRAARDANGRALEVIEVPRPKAREIDGRALVRSYLNFYPANGAVIVPVFDDVADDRAFSVIAKTFPERQPVAVQANDVVYGGGGIHCITQPQPARR